MAPELKKVSWSDLSLLFTPVELRSIGFDEKWLQARINEDPSLLGLGQLEVAGKEHKQPVGGRIDFLMRDSEAETYYEIEVMLGTLDESHIIRTIEYWDIERQRRPQFEHYAVIVAERVTSRFFNVLRLLNRSAPLIALQLSAFRIDDFVVLHFVKVLDVVEEITDPETDQPEQADRGYWEKKADPTSLSMMDKILSSLRDEGINTKLTYNRYHVALTTTGYNFCWFEPRKTPGRCYIQIRTGRETRDAILSMLQEAGLSASVHAADYVTLSLTTKTLEQHSAQILDAIKRAEEASR
jgi:hypothetical protein